MKRPPNLSKALRYKDFISNNAASFGGELEIEISPANRLAYEIIACDRPYTTSATIASTRNRHKMGLIHRIPIPLPNWAALDRFEALSVSRRVTHEQLSRLLHPKSPESFITGVWITGAQRFALDHHLRHPCLPTCRAHCASTSVTRGFRAANTRCFFSRHSWHVGTRVRSPYFPSRELFRHWLYWRDRGEVSIQREVRSLAQLGTAWHLLRVYRIIALGYLSKIESVRRAQLRSRVVLHLLPSSGALFAPHGLRLLPRTRGDRARVER